MIYTWGTILHCTARYTLLLYTPSLCGTILHCIVIAIHKICVIYMQYTSTVE